MLVYDENRVWVRLTNYCASKCKFCLEDPSIRKLPPIPDEDIKLKIKNGFKEGYKKNKLILSGGEASINPHFFDFIKYGKEVGYNKIQTVTNGLRWGSFDFCKTAVEAGLDEVTFSIHGHNTKLHDWLTEIPGSFKNMVKAMHYFRTSFPHVILNADIVVNPENIKDVYKIIQVLKKLDIREYDILQVIPFGFAWQHKDEMLFENIYEFKDSFNLIWKESIDHRVHMWANRVYPDLLEGFESMIQSPEKIEDEVANEGREHREESFNKREKFSCSDQLRCKNCYVKYFCHEKYKFYELEKTEYKSDLKNYYKLYTHKSIFKVDKHLPETPETFLEKIKKDSMDKDSVVNIPYCIEQKNNYFTNFMDSGLEKTFDNYISWFEDEGFRLKSLRCKECKLFEKCQGIHINIIKKYGFKILNPIK